MFGKAPLTSREALMGFHRVHVGDGALEEDGLVLGPAWDGPPEAGWYVGVRVGADAA